MDEKASEISQVYAPKGYALSGKIMLSAIVVLFTVVVIIVCLHVYARWFIVRAHRRRIRRRAHLVFYTDTANPPHNMPSRGLDAALLRSLPVFVYSSKSHEEAPECAVCLSEFEENEKGRLLPKCNHSFHIDCIDMWFHSHSTCPICRGPVMPEIPTPVSETSLEIVVSDGEQAVGTEEGAGSSGLCASCENNTQDRVGSSSSSASIPEGSSSLGPRRNQVELVGVSIEVPRRNECYRWGTEEEMRLGSPGGQGLKSPGSGGRIRSLKRILSRDRRMGAVSPRSASAQNCSSATDPDLERGREEGEAVQARTPR